MVNIGNEWDSLLEAEFEKDYYKRIREFLANEYRTTRVFPDMYDIFNALKYTPYSSVKAVILGQDPYHGEGQAHGLCFSVKRGIEPPPSLKNIYKELVDDVGFVPPKHGELIDWARQGVLLLNTVLTVRSGEAKSHRNMGWEIFTDRIIELLNESDETRVFLLWGSDAEKKRSLITNPKHRILSSVHPSPLSAYRGFFGCKHFSKANEILKGVGKTPIDWTLQE